MENKTDDKRCENCGSTQTHIRIKTNERVCNSCGYISSINSNTEEEDGNTR